jgi:hypothetical protein
MDYFMSTIVLSGDTSGAITIAAPAVAGTNTLTLPASTGTVALTSQLPVAGPAFGVYLSSNQTISSGTQTKIQFNTEEFDTANCFDSTTNYRFTPTTAGYYQLNLVVGTGSSTNACVPTIYKNGSAFKQTVYYWASTGVSTNLGISTIVYLNGSTDYIEFWALQNGGTTFTGGQIATFATGALIRSA